jgi:hypothetical protein
MQGPCSSEGSASDTGTIAPSTQLACPKKRLKATNAVAENPSSNPRRLFPARNRFLHQIREGRLQKRQWQREWAAVLRGLDQFQEIELRIQSKSFVMRTPNKGATGKVFQACGVALAPTMRAT